MRWFILVIGLLLYGCMVPIPTTPSTVNPMDYLVEWQCADDGRPMLENCTDGVQRTANSNITWYRHDYPGPGDAYQISDAYINPAGNAETVWIYPPYGNAASNAGNGGEWYKINNNGVVTIAETQAGPPNQFFRLKKRTSNLNNCGDTGWVAFTKDAPTIGQTWIVARLGIVGTASACPSSPSFAFTRWRLENVTYPFIVFGVAGSVTAPTIISEHYDGPSIGLSSTLERSFWGYHWGRLVWEYWTTTPSTDPNLLDIRCPGTDFSNSPGPGWYLNDCRDSTQIIKGPGTPVFLTYGWP